MFDFFKFKKHVEDASNVYKLPTAKTVPVEPVDVPTKENNEHYRVGHTTDGDTTLTLRSNDGASMTLTMSQDACEKMIRMLRSTYDQSVEEDA